MANQIITVIIADDAPMTRDGIRRIVESSDDIQVVAEAGSGEEAVQLATIHRPDVALLDADMSPGWGGVKAAKAMIEAQLPTRTIIVTSYADFLTDALAAGIPSYFLKKGKGPDLIEAVRLTATGASYFHTSLHTELAKMLSRGLIPGLNTELREPLTDREKEVLYYLILGKPNKEISATLGIAEPTVKGAVGRIFDKLQVENRTEAAIKGHALGYGNGINT